MQLDNPAVDDLSAVNLRQKRQAYRKRNFLVVTPNQWLGRLARDSGIFPADTRFETVHYGIDTERFVSHDTSNLQNRLGIDDRRINLLFGAVDVDVPRKGLAVLLQSLHQLSQPERYRCLVFGNGDSVQRFQQELPESMEVRQLGYLSTDEELCAAYSAADIFLLPSLEDNQPQTGLEALACGTPVVAFDTGGISEMIRPGFNGWLARPHDAAHFAQLISLLGRDRGMQAEFGRNGRNLIVDEFEVGKQSARYIELYEELLRKKLSDPESMQNGEPIDSRGWSRAG